MKKVYICSPCRGDYKNNIQRAKEYSRAAVAKGCIPITPHIYLTQFMDDTVPAERELALSFGRELVLICDELWAFGLDHPSAGMTGEIGIAKEAGIPVVNGFRAISELDTGVSAASAIMFAAEELSQPKEQPAKVGNVTITLPPRRAFAAGIPDFPGMALELDGHVILDLAAKLRATPGASFEIGGDGRDE